MGAGSGTERAPLTIVPEKLTGTPGLSEANIRPLKVPVAFEERMKRPTVKVPSSPRAVSPQETRRAEALGVVKPIAGGGWSAPF